MAGMLLMGMYWYVFPRDSFPFGITTRVSERIAGARGDSFTTKILLYNSNF